MSQQCVVAVYESFDRAKNAVRALERADFPHEQVSFVTHSVADEAPRENALQFGDEAESSAVKGAGLGGLVGVLLSAPLVTVSGLGVVLMAGPVALGLAGAIVGGFLGAMSGWGVHPDHVRRYEQQVAQGALLVIANGDPEQIVHAEKVLQETGPDDLHLHAETSADTVEP